MNVLRIHEYLTAQGYPIESVTDLGSAVRVHLKDSATPQQRQDAQNAADTWQPSVQDRRLDALEMIPDAAFKLAVLEYFDSIITDLSPPSPIKTLVTRWRQIKQQVR